MFLMGEEVSQAFKCSDCGKTTESLYYVNTYLAMADGRGRYGLCRECYDKLLKARAESCQKKK